MINSALTREEALEDIVRRAIQCFEGYVVDYSWVDDYQDLQCRDGVEIANRLNARRAAA